MFFYFFPLRRSSPVRRVLLPLGLLPWMGAFTTWTPLLPIRPA